MALFLSQSTTDPEGFVQSTRKVWMPPPKNRKFTEIDQNAKNTKIVRMTSHSQGRLSKKSAVQKYRVSIFGTIERDFSGTPEKTNNRQTAMNFGNAQILMAHNLEGSLFYHMVETIPKSDEKWICYSDF